MMAAASPSVEEQFSRLSLQGQQPSQDHADEGVLGYYSMPTLHGDKVIFVCEDDLWRGTVSGSPRWSPPHRLTSGLQCSFPLLSPDGKTVAFSAEVGDKGATEVFTMASSGGAINRLTHFGSYAAPVAWQLDGKSVIVTSTYEQINSYHQHLFRVAVPTADTDPTSAHPHPLPLSLGLADSCAFATTGNGTQDPSSAVPRLLGRHTSDPHISQFKGYKGGASGVIWIDPQGDGEYAKLELRRRGGGGGDSEESREGVSVGSPMWLGDRVVFVAEDLQMKPYVDGDTAAGAGACANIFSCSLQGDDVRRHTFQKDHYVRNPTLESGPGAHRVVYHAGGDLFVLDLGQDCRSVSAPVHLDYRLWTARTKRQPRIVQPSDYLEEYCIHPKGHHIGVIARGQPFEMALWEGPALPLNLSSLHRCYGAHYLSDGRLATFCLPPDGPIQLMVRSMAERDPNEWLRALAEEEMQESQGQPRVEPYISDLLQPADAPPLLPVDLSWADGSTDPVDVGLPEDVESSPTSSCIAMVNHRLELLLITLDDTDKPQREKGKGRGKSGRDGGGRESWDACASRRIASGGVTGRVTVVCRGEHEGGIGGLAWSPDGQWLAFAYMSSAEASVIRLYHVPTGQLADVTKPRFKDFSPAFDRGGRYLYFLSNRAFITREDEVHFDLGFAGSIRPYAVTLQRSTPSPLKRLPTAPADDHDEEEEESEDEDEDEEESEDDDSDDEDGDEGEEDKSAPPPVLIDLDGIHRRILEFPLPAGDYRQVDSLAAEGSSVRRGGIVFVRRHLKGGRKADVREGPQEEEQEGKGHLFSFDFSRMKERKLADDVDSFQVSHDGRTTALLCEEDDETTLRVYETGVKPSEEDSDGEDIDEDQPGRESGLIDIDGRITLEVTPADEWVQMFAETWRRLGEFFFDKHMGGLNWNRIKHKYWPLLGRLGCRRELTDVIEEMISELGVGHTWTYGRGDDTEHKQLQHDDDAQGFLGADFDWSEEAQAYRITHMVCGDAWDACGGGPLSAVGVGEVKEGDYVVAIDGRRLSRHITPQHTLRDRAGKEVYVTIVPSRDLPAYLAWKSADTPSSPSPPTAPPPPAAADRRKDRERASSKDKDKGGGKGSKGGGTTGFLTKRRDKKRQGGGKGHKHKGGGGDDGRGGGGGGGGSRIEMQMLHPPWRTVRVKAVGVECDRVGRCRDWVEKNGNTVHTRTNGRVGYVRVPDTERLGFAEFHRYYLVECQRDALIVDVRGNLGGYSSELMLEKLQRRHLGYNAPRQGRGVPTSYPRHSVDGPMVMLADENAGSDADVWCHTFKLLKLGPLVGKRTWGSVVSVGPCDVDLVDGGTVAVPYEHYFTHDVGFGLENWGVDPDVTVEYAPQHYRSGVDPQLDRAIEMAMKLLDKGDEERQNVRARLREFPPNPRAAVMFPPGDGGDPPSTQQDKDGRLM